MTANDFINNLHGLCDGQDFSRELLKVLYMFTGLVSSYHYSYIFRLLIICRSPSLFISKSLDCFLDISKNSILYLLELTVGFESNTQINSDRKASKYNSLIKDLKYTYSDVKFVNLSMSTIGIIGNSSESLLLVLDDLNLDKPAQNSVIRKVMNIAIRCTYYVFCRRNKTMEQS